MKYPYPHVAKVTYPVSGKVEYKTTSETDVNWPFIIDIPNPADASSMVLSWRVLNAENDWWWAIDNVYVYGRRPDNVSPEAYVQTVPTEEDVAANITLTGNADADTHSDLSFQVQESPQHGVLFGEAPNLVYTPNSDYNGSDSFTFKTNDGTADSTEATVTLTVTPVNDAPVVSSQTLNVAEDASVSIDVTGTDVESDTLTYSVVTRPSHGSIRGEAPNLSYGPDLHYNGDDSFTFVANDGNLNSAEATVSLTVVAVNDTPVSKELTLSTEEDLALNIYVGSHRRGWGQFVLYRSQSACAGRVVWRDANPDLYTQPGL